MTTTENFAIDGALVICYNRRAYCEERVEELSKMPYHLDSYEEGRPAFSVRYIIRYGMRRYYVYAEYKYDADSHRGKKDGPFERVEW